LIKTFYYPPGIWFAVIGQSTQIQGVSFIVNLGGFVKQYQVFLKPNMMKHYDITIKDVKEAIEGSNRNFSGGLILKKNQELLIKGIGKIQSTDHIGNTVITSRDNVPVYVKDVAEIKTGGKFRRGDAGYNGKEAVSVVVQKQYGGNTLETIAHVKQFLHQVRKDLPKNVKVTPYYDQSELIESSIKHVEISMLIGGILVVGLIFLFLGNMRASLIASLAIE